MVSLIFALTMLLALLEQTLQRIVGFTKEQIQTWVERFTAMLPPFSGTKCSL